MAWQGLGGSLTNGAVAVHVAELLVGLQDAVEQAGEAEQFDLVPPPGAHGARLAERARPQDDRPDPGGACIRALAGPAAGGDDADHRGPGLVLRVPVVEPHAIRQPPLHDTCNGVSPMMTDPLTHGRTLAPRFQHQCSLHNTDMALKTVTEQSTAAACKYVKRSGDQMTLC